MNHFEPLKTYPNTDEIGTSSLAVTELRVMQATRVAEELPEVSDQVIQVMVAIPRTQLIALLHEHPEYFADLPAYSLEKILENEQDTKNHRTMMEQLKDPGSQTSTFNKWFENRPANLKFEK